MQKTHAETECVNAPLFLFLQDTLLVSPRPVILTMVPGHTKIHASNHISLGVPPYAKITQYKCRVA